MAIDHRVPIQTLVPDTWRAWLRIEAAKQGCTQGELVCAALLALYPQLKAVTPVIEPDHVTMDDPPTVIDVPPETLADVVPTTPEMIEDLIDQAVEDGHHVELHGDGVVTVEVDAADGSVLVATPDPLAELEAMADDIEEDPEMCAHKRRRQSRTLGLICDDCGVSMTPGAS